MRSIAYVAKAALIFCLASLLVIGPVGCSGFAFVTSFPPASSIVTMSGVVTVIQITTIQAPAGTSTITVVTFVQQNNASTINLCGNVGGQFVINAFATVNFTQGPSCGNVVTIWTG